MNSTKALTGCSSPERMASRGKSNFGRGYYWPDGMVARQPELTPVAAMQAIPQVDPQEYFKRLGLSVGGELDFPSNLSDLMDRYDSLEDDARAKFDRACHWFSSASIPGISLSHSFTSLISAVEAIVPDDALPRCEECGTIRGVTKRFRDFVALYAPVEREEDSKVPNVLYGLRSELSHGGLLLRPDWESRWGSLHPLAIQHRSDAGDAWRDSFGSHWSTG